MTSAPASVRILAASSAPASCWSRPKQPMTTRGVSTCISCLSTTAVSLQRIGAHAERRADGGGNLADRRLTRERSEDLLDQVYVRIPRRCGDLIERLCDLGRRPTSLPGPNLFDTRVARLDLRRRVLREQGVPALVD